MPGGEIQPNIKMSYYKTPALLFVIKCVHSTEISHDDGGTFYPRCYDDEEEAVHCVDVMD